MRRPLEAGAPAAAEPQAREGAVVGERRHLTILFCDLVGSVMPAEPQPREGAVVPPLALLR